MLIPTELSDRWIICLHKLCPLSISPSFFLSETKDCLSATNRTRATDYRSQVI